MTLNRKVITQVDQVLAITYVYEGCQCIKMGCHFTRTLISPMIALLGLTSTTWQSKAWRCPKKLPKQHAQRAKEKAT